MSVLKRVTKCDICGEYGCDYDGRLKIKQRKDLFYESWMTRFDICPKCATEMKNWIKIKINKNENKANRVVGVTREFVQLELNAQFAAGHITKETYKDIITHLFEEEDE